MLALLPFVCPGNRHYDQSYYIISKDELGYDQRYDLVIRSDSLG